MGKISLLHTGDLHLGGHLPSLGRKGPRRVEEKIQGFFRLLKFCQERQVDFLLIAGDFFEGRPSPDLLHAVQDRLGSLQGVRVVMTPGNHDYLALDSAYRAEGWPSNTYIFDGSQDFFDFPDLKTRIYGVPFRHSLEQTPLLNQVNFKPKPDGWIQLGLFHGDWVSPGQTSDYNPISPDQIPKDFFSYLALGHVHKRGKPGQVGFTTYAYSGNPDGNSFSDPSPKGAYWVDLTPHQADLKFIPFSSRLFLKAQVDLTGVKTGRAAENQVMEALRSRFDSCLEGLKKELVHDWGEEGSEDLLAAPIGQALDRDFQDQFYRVDLLGTPDFQLNLEGLGQALADKIYYLEIRDQTKPALDLEGLAQGQGLVASFVSAWLDRKRQAQGQDQEVLDRALRFSLDAFEGREDGLVYKED